MFSELFKVSFSKDQPESLLLWENVFFSLGLVSGFWKVSVSGWVGGGYFWRVVEPVLVRRGLERSWVGAAR